MYTGLCKSTLCVDYKNIPTHGKFSVNGKYVLLNTLNNLITLWDWQEADIC